MHKVVKLSKADSFIVAITSVSTFCGVVRKKNKAAVALVLGGKNCIIKLF
jgi:hypothetical protein